MSATFDRIRTYVSDCGTISAILSLYRFVYRHLDSLNKHCEFHYLLSFSLVLLLVPLFSVPFRLSPHKSCACVCHSVHLPHTIFHIPSRRLIIDIVCSSAVVCTGCANAIGIHASFVFRNKTLISKLVRQCGVRSASRLLGLVWLFVRFIATVQVNQQISTAKKKSARQRKQRM